MVWDLHNALVKKQEMETARLLDFEFRHRARTMRLLAQDLGLDGIELVRRIVLESDEAILCSLSGPSGLSQSELACRFEASRACARVELMKELGDPSPYRLA